MSGSKETVSPTTARIDKIKANAFMDKVFGDVTGTYISLMCCIGDRLDLFKKLEMNGPATSIELSNISGTNERYTREWFNAMASAGYLQYDSSTQRFGLPPEHSPVLTQEGGPMFVAGIYQQLLAEKKNMQKLIELFKNGGGIALKEFDENEFEGMERMTAS
jgi:hypothetical protein